MADYDEIAEALQEILRDLLADYDNRIPDSGPFKDVKAGRTVHFGDPDTTRPGRIELAVMHMNSEIDRGYASLRFVSVRVWKSQSGGMASVTCFHTPKPQLKQELQEQALEPSYLVDRVEELAHGLPEETNPDVWK